MAEIVKNEKLKESINDAEIADLNEKIKQLEQQIVKIIEQITSKQFYNTCVQALCLYTK